MPLDATVVRDVVVVIPGIMGSELVDADGRPVWSVSAGALTRAIRTLGGSLRGLQLEPGIGDEAPGGSKRVTATRLIESLHVIPGLWSPITGYDGLLRFLRSERFHLIDAYQTSDGDAPNLIPFPYDWRLSNRYNGRRLAQVAVPALERWQRQPGMREAKLVLIAHSMGGLVARWFAEQEGGAELIRALITIGTPHRGSLNALATLVNGIEPAIGPLSLSLTAFARSLPALYQLLPRYACVNTNEGRVCLERAGCAELDPDMLKDATRFHEALSGPAITYPLHKVAGIRQPTATTADIFDRRVYALDEIDGLNQGGDGTVPRLAAEPVAGRGVEVHEVAGQHGELQESRSVLDLVDGILSRQEIIWQDVVAEPFGVQMQEIWTTGEQPVLRVTELNNRRMKVNVQDEAGVVVREGVPVSPDGTAILGDLPEGGYTAVVAPTWKAGPRPVTKPFLVFRPTE
ncbi:MAG: hypothetical protein JNN08_15125 [Bryobacterales bacterium]|nr:hypothetical protein [Bryobacterales bacterium]